MAPLVSVIIPCRNEAPFIGPCLDSIVKNNWPKDQLEVLVVDGMSEDGTRELVSEYVEQHPFIKLLDNPKLITPAALNEGIRHAQGTIVMRMDAHTVYVFDYIEKCVHAIDEYGADNVGGRLVTLPRTETLLGKAIVCALSHWFGVGNSHFRIASSGKPQWVDTVPFFCMKRETLDRIGPFNERLARGQDMEFSLRLKRAGLKTLLVPEIVSQYYARTELLSFLKHNWTNGVWAILPFAYSDVIPVSWRHLIPFTFVLSLMTLSLLSWIQPRASWLLMLIGMSYLALNIAASAQIVRQVGDWRLGGALPMVFLLLHLSYGFGSLWGALKLVFSGVWLKRIVRMPRQSVPLLP